jgi:hypothetical protein
LKRDRVAEKFKLNKIDDEIEKECENTISDTHLIVFWMLECQNKHPGPRWTQNIENGLHGPPSPGWFSQSSDLKCFLNGI